MGGGLYCYCVLTTYDGQKLLIHGAVQRQCTTCGIGPPSKVTTLDEVQGQQNNFILFSSAHDLWATFLMLEDWLLQRLKHNLGCMNSVVVLCSNGTMNCSQLF